MSLRDRLGKRRSATEFAPPDTPATWDRQSDWLSTWGPPRNLIVGEERRQDALRAIAGTDGGCLLPVDVTLQPEPGNPHDANAMAALVAGRHIGYLRGEVAAQIAEGCRQHRLAVPTMIVAGVLRGGHIKGGRATSIGAHVWLERLLTPGPRITFDDQQHVVSWPPLKKELAVLPR